MTTYWMSTTGVDTNSGTSQANAWATLYKASTVMVSGDILNIVSGTYTPAGGGQYFNGKSNLTFQGFGQRPTIICTSGKGGMQFDSSNYITLKNLAFRGDSDNITYSDALAAYNAGTSTSDPVYSANGIIFKEGHHNSVIDCFVSKFPGGGIAFTNNDYFTVDGCLVTDCAKYSAWGNQGITALYAYNFDSNTSTYRNKFTNNIALRNISLIPWSTAVGGTGTINEGHGIMLDTTNVDKSSVAYTGKTLVSNNFSARNGGAGIQIYKAKNVDLTDNFTSENNQNLSSGELLLHYSDLVTFRHSALAPKDSSSYYARIKYTTNCEFTYNSVLDFYNLEDVGNTSLTKYATT